MIPYRFTTLLLVSALAACSGKPEAPRAPAAQPATQPAPTTPPAPATASAPSAPAEPAAPVEPTITVQRKATVDCDDRSIVVEATCSGAPDDAMLMCSKQSLTVADRATGTAKAVRDFTPAPDTDKNAPPQIEEKIGELTCVRSANDVRYIVADMYNGGNCEECEWHELYDWDGKLVASDRDRRKRHALLTELVGAADGKTGRVIAKTEMNQLYQGKPL